MKSITKSSILNQKQTKIDSEIIENENKIK